MKTQISELMQIAASLEDQGRLAHIDFPQDVVVNVVGNSGDEEIMVTINGEVLHQRQRLPKLKMSMSDKVKLGAQINSMLKEQREAVTKIAIGALPLQGVTKAIAKLYLDVHGMSGNKESREKGKKSAEFVQNVLFGKSVRMYMPVDNDKTVIEVAEACNKMQVRQSRDVQSFVSVLEDNAQFMREQSEEQVVMLSRFVKQRQTFFNNYAMYDQKEVLRTLNYPLSNVGRTITTLIADNNVIWLEFAGKKHFPAFQFNHRAQVYPALLAVIPKMLQAGKDMWDICFWLTTPMSVLLQAKRPVSKDLVGISLEELKEVAAKASGEAQYYHEAPLQALMAGDEDAFAQLAKRWLNADEVDYTPPGAIAGGVNG